MDADLIAKCRAETPGVQHVNHLNNAGAALMPQVVIDAMQDHLLLEAHKGGYEAAALQKALIEDFYNSCAELIGARAEQIAFTSSATDAYNRALSSIAFQPGDVILTTTNDYASNFIAFISLKKRMDIKIKIARNTSTGEVDLSSLQEDLYKFNPKLLAVTHVPTNSGMIQPVVQIGELNRSPDCYFLVDSCQAVGQLNVDASAIGCDFLSATFRKFLRGPRGAGFLYVSPRVLKEGLEPLFPDMRGADWSGTEHYQARVDAKRFEEWEKAYALVLGARASIQYLLTLGIQKVEKRVRYLAEHLRLGLADDTSIRLLDRGVEKCGIVSIHIPGANGKEAKLYLRSHQINSSLSVRTSALLDFQEKGVDWTLRLSPHYYNTEEEIQKVIEKLTLFVK